MVLVHEDLELLDLSLLVRQVRPIAIGGAVTALRTFSLAGLPMSGAGCGLWLPRSGA